MKVFLLPVPVFVLSAILVHATDQPPEGWTSASPREAIAPRFHHDPCGGRDSKGALVIKADARDGLAGRRTKTVPVQDGLWYHCETFRRVRNVAEPRRSVLARVIWLDNKSQPALRGTPVVSHYYAAGTGKRTEPEYPMDKPPTDAGGRKCRTRIARRPMLRVLCWSCISAGHHTPWWNGARFR